MSKLLTEIAAVVERCIVRPENGLAVCKLCPAPLQDAKKDSNILKHVRAVHLDVIFTLLLEAREGVAPTAKPPTEEYTPHEAWAVILATSGCAAYGLLHPRLRRLWRIAGVEPPSASTVVRRIEEMAEGERQAQRQAFAQRRDLCIIPIIDHYSKKRRLLLGIYGVGASRRRRQLRGGAGTHLRGCGGPAGHEGDVGAIPARRPQPGA